MNSSISERNKISIIEEWDKNLGEYFHFVKAVHTLPRALAVEVSLNLDILFYYL